MATRNPFNEHLPPAMPVEAFEATCDLNTIYKREHIRAHRMRFNESMRPDEPDLIQLSTNAGAIAVQFTLTPAMIVHLANTMLTENERAAILAPALAGGLTE